MSEEHLRTIIKRFVREIFLMKENTRLIEYVKAILGPRSLKKMK